MSEVALPSIPPFDEAAAAAAAERLHNLTKPRGSLGRLEDLALRLAGMQAKPLPSVAEKLVVVAAADHGVTDQGVSAYPSAVTRQMVANFLAGKAAVNVLADLAGARLVVIDAGIRVPLKDPRLLDLRFGPGTADFSGGPAMSPDIARAVLARGIEFGADSATADVVACGEMGIGNSTAAAAVTAALLGLRASAVTGPGAGLDAEALAHKARVIDEAIALNRPDAADPADVLAKVGGFEIGLLAGIMIGAASRRRVVLLDGLISSAAALLASRLAPGLREYTIASHLSPEPGHRWILDELGLEPLLDLNLRLGEGSGAALALPLLEAACRVLRDMATFEEAGVLGRDAGRDANFE